VGRQRGVQVAKRRADLGCCLAALGVDCQQFVHMPREIQHDGPIDGLAGEARPAAAGEQRNPPLGTVRDHAGHVGGRGGEDDADGGHLVRARVRGVQLSGVVVEPNVARQPVGQLIDHRRPVDAGASIVVVCPRVDRGVVARVLLGSAHARWSGPANR